MERFAQSVVKALSQALQKPLALTDLELPPDPKLGDFAFPCFRLAKERRLAPPALATELAKQIQDQKLLPAGITAHAAGPYLNFSVDPQSVFGPLLDSILKDGARYGSLPARTRGKWVLEYSSPNIAKPLMFHHLRSTALGAALDRIGQYRGFDVVSINHLGDWGKQYGMYVVAFKRFGKQLSDAISMEELGQLYVKVNALAEQDPTVTTEAGESFVRLEKGDPDVTAFWKKCVDLSTAEHDRVYARLGVTFTHVWGESFYKDQLIPLIEDLKKRELLYLSEGAWVVDVTTPDGKPLPPCIVLKSDGGTIYATRDLAAAIYRWEKFHFDRMTYIVGGEQRVHFQQVFGVLKRMGHDWVERCEHVPFGLYRFKDAKMSTRKGNAVTLEDVLDLAKDRVKQLMEERAAGRTEGTIEGMKPTDAVTEAVSLGAVLFWELSTDPARDSTFDLESIVDFEGETGPYLQYAHTRCLSILRKGRESQTFTGAVDLKLLVKPEELALVKTLGRFPLFLERTLAFAKASQLSTYLIDVTKAFGAFYRECKVLDEANPELSRSRLQLVDATRAILSQGLELLGIPRPERM